MKNNNVHLEGIVSYKNDRGDFILQVDDDFFHCRGDSDLEIGTPKTVDGCLRSFIKRTAGRKTTHFYVETIVTEL